MFKEELTGLVTDVEWEARERGRSKIAPAGGDTNRHWEVRTGIR